MRKQWLQKWIWLVAGVGCLTFCGRAQDIRPLSISIRTEEPTNLYYDADTIAIQSAVIAYVTIVNKGVAEFKGSFDYHILDYWGERVAKSRRSVSLNLAKDERVVHKELFQVTKRGPYVFVAQVKSGKEVITETHSFAIIPKPKGVQYPDSFFGVKANAAAAQSAAFLQRLGVSPFHTPAQAEGINPFLIGPNLRASGFARSVDRRKRMSADKPLTIEVGEVTDDIEDRRAAPKLVAQHVTAALAGAYHVDMKEGTIGPSQLRESAAYATMVSLLDGRAPVWDLFPSAPNLWGAVFASPAVVDPEMRVLRKDAIATRWKTAGDPKDETKVAVLWSYVGTDARHVDKGTLVIEDSEGIDALDLFGNPIGERSNARRALAKTRLSVPIGEVPVYFTSRLPVQSFANRIASARLEDLTPVALQVLPMTEPPDRAQKLVVRVQNQLNRPIGGTLTLNLPIGWSVQPSSYPFTLGAGEMKDVAFDVAGAIANRDNLYAISVTAEVDKKKHERAQVVQVAAAVYGAAQVDGDLRDWTDAYPVSLEYEQLTHPDAYARALLNPRGKRPEPSGTRRTVSARVYTKWDEENFYFAAEVTEPELAPAKEFWNGDAVQLAFSLNDRAQDDYHAADDPWRWKGAFRDTEYGFVILPTKDAAAVVRLFAPGTPFDVRATEATATVKRARAVVRRDDAAGKTYYEAAIPLAEIGGLKPQDGLRFRFGFLLHNNEGVRSGRLQWSEAAGVWDDLTNVGSFLPPDEPFLPCQTVWECVGPTRRIAQGER